MTRRLAWSDVGGGLLACGLIAAAAIGIMTFMRVGAMHGKTFRVYALVGEARGVSKGSEVWLSGQKIGRITDIEFRPPGVGDSTSRILLTMEVLEAHRDMIRRDAEAQIRAGGSIIGAPVVYMTAGSLGAGPLQPGDTVRTVQQSDMEGATAQFAGAAKEIPAIIANVKALHGELQGTEGTVGAFMNGPGFGELQRSRGQMTRFMGRLRGRGGSVGPIMNGGLTSRAGRVMARVDSVRTLLASNQTSLGRLRRDSTLLAEVGDIRDELARVRATLADSNGTVGRARADSALTNAVGDAQREMTLLFADMRKHPRRYLSFSF